jgi:hypothetical protein
MKKGKYIDYNILLACYSSKKEIANQRPETNNNLRENIFQNIPVIEKENNWIGNSNPNSYQQFLTTIYYINRMIQSYSGLGFYEYEKKTNQ